MLVLTSAAAALGAGCGDNGNSSGSGSGSSGGGGSDAGGGGSGGSAPMGACYDYTTFKADDPLVSFSMQVLPLLRRSCGLSDSCHGAPNPPTPAQHYLGPKLTDPEPSASERQTIIDGVVGVGAVKEPTMKVIELGNPQRSFFMYKLDGLSCDKLTCMGDACGVLMPKGSTQPLPVEERDTIRRWIAQGAQNN
jgi:hypothetical protein